METLITFSAGLFAGGSIVLIVWLYSVIALARKIDAERMQWCNKAVVRDGQTRIFSDAQIIGAEPVIAPNVVTASSRPMSPFQSGLVGLKAKLAEEKKQEAGDTLPDNLKLKIKRDVEEVKAA